MVLAARASAVTVTLLAAASLAACGGSDKKAAPAGGSTSNSAGTSTSPSPSGPATKSGGTGDSSQQAQGASGAGGRGGRCRTSDLKADLIFQDAEQGRVNSMLTLTNTSKRPCSVKGTVTATVYDASGKPANSLTVPKNHPGKASKITLKPGVSAFSGVQWKATPGCPTAGALGVSAPNEDGVAKVNAQSFGGEKKSLARWRICGGQVTVGTLQPASQGVNFQ